MVDSEINLVELVNMKITNLMSVNVASYLGNLRNCNQDMIKKRDYPLGDLLALQKKTSKKVVKDKQGLFMINFPIFWFKLWNSRYVNISEDGESIFVHSCDDEKGSTNKLIKVSGTYYIKISSEIMSKFNYPNEFEIFFYETYLQIVVPKHEKDKILSRMPEINKRKKNLEMRNRYARSI